MTEVNNTPKQQLHEIMLDMDYKYNKKTGKFKCITL